MFPRLFSISLRKDCLGSSFFSPSNNRNFQLRRGSREEEISEISSLLSLLHNVSLQPRLEDTRIWTLSSSGFSTSLLSFKPQVPLIVIPFSLTKGSGSPFSPLKFKVLFGKLLGDELRSSSDYSPSSLFVASHLCSVLFRFED